MLKFGINFAQHYVQCALCDRSAEYYCYICAERLCLACRDHHIQSDTTTFHAIVLYQDRQPAPSKTEPCRVHQEFCYEMACELCKLPVCSRCKEEDHRSHTFKNINDALKESEKRCNIKIQNIKKAIIPKWRDTLSTLSEEKVESKEEISKIRSQLQDDAKKLKDLVDVIVERNCRSLDCEEERINDYLERQATLISGYITNNEQLIDNYEDKKRGPYEKLMLRKEIFESDVMEFEETNLKRPVYLRENVSEDNVANLLGKLSIPESTLPQENKNHVESNPVSIAFKLPFSDARHISYVLNNRLWIGNGDGQIVLTDDTGEVLGKINTAQINNQHGCHTVTKEGDLLYIDRFNNSIKKYTSLRMKTTFIVTGDWTPLCIFSSPKNGAILVGEYQSMLARVTRYDKERGEPWSIQFDAEGNPLYQSPLYITENLNGDICTSDGCPNNAVVVVNKDRNHRFTYRGHEGESNFYPRGICIDDQGRILVINEHNSIHVIDQDGHFVTFLLTKCEKTGLQYNVGICINESNTLWTCGKNEVRVFKLSDVM
ncbi:E3 ubiquitin-protein ligase TRIM71-like [Saccostrea cucullata]|uniref:E3 ubiquitin-protein ligase TRIM71-like n=1 Tax=Saccostrea cuccullata TaxID=36930 RepID=UPI002ED3484E